MPSNGPAADNRLHSLGSDPSGRSESTGLGGGGKQRKSQHFEKKAPVAKIVLITLAVLLVALAILAALLAKSAFGIRDQVSQLQTQAPALASSISNGESTAILTYSRQIDEEVRAINAELSSPTWAIASVLPVIGGDVSSIRRLVSTAADLTSNALIPASQVIADHPTSTLIINGAFNGPAVREYCSLLTEITPNLQSAAAVVNEASVPHIQQIEDLLAQARGPLNEVSAALGTYGPIIKCAPDILGCNGTRNYLVIAQNNVEIRSTGGFPGAMATATIENGALSIGEIGGTGDFVFTREITFPVTDEEYVIFGPDPGAYIGNVAFIPDFQRVGELYNAFWQRDKGRSFDGIIAIDPLVLQDLVGLTGSITMPDGMVLTGDNTATALMHDAYWMYVDDNEMQDVYFAQAAAAILGQFMSINSAALDLSDMLEVINTDIQEGRILVYMTDPEEEQCFDLIGCSGRLSMDETKPVLGVYYNDNTGSKYDWWLSTSTTIDATRQNPDGSTTYWVTSSITNTATWEEINAANNYIYGGNPEKRDIGDMMTTIYIFAPAGGTLTGITINPDPGPDQFSWDVTPYRTLQVLRTHPHLEPGETFTATFEVNTSPNATSPLQIRQTPTAERARE